MSADPLALSAKRSNSHWKLRGCSAVIYTTAAVAGAMYVAEQSEVGSWKPQQDIALKVAPIACMLLLASIRAWLAPSRFSVLLACAYLGHAAGDAFLEMPGYGCDACFVVGMGCFFVGHSLNLVAFCSSCTPSGYNVGSAMTNWRRLIPFPIFVICFLGMLFAVGINPTDRLTASPVLMAAVPVYACALAGAAAACTLRVGASPEECRAAWLLTAAGYMVYIISDATLALTKFSVQVQEPGRSYIVMSTYYLGQILISLACDAPDGTRSPILWLGERRTSKK